MLEKSLEQIAQWIEMKREHIAQWIEMKREHILRDVVKDVIPDFDYNRPHKYRGRLNLEVCSNGDHKYFIDNTLVLTTSTVTGGREIILRYMKHPYSETPYVGEEILKLIE